MSRRAPTFLRSIGILNHFPFSLTITDISDDRWWEIRGWCEDNFGPSALVLKWSTVSESGGWDLNTDLLWYEFGKETFWFKHQKHAAVFKLMWHNVEEETA
jgi:hypothetical protein